MSGVGADHERSKSADRVIDAAQIGVEYAVPLFRRQVVQHITESADPCVVYQYIETAECAINASGRIFKLVQHGDIAGNHFGLAPGVDDGAGSFVQRGFCAPEQHGGGAKGGEFAGDRRADTAACSGYD